MSPGRIVAAIAAAALVALIVTRRRRLGGELKVLAFIAALGLAVFASGLLSELPSPEKVIEDVAKALGKGTYALVGAMAFLETGAFVGFIAPGEFTVILGGVIAGEGTIAIVPLIGLVWFCAVAGDSASFYIGHRFGRGLMLRHGPKLKITEERFERVERFFERYGGRTIVIGRFLGFVRPLAPFIAGTSSTMPYGRFLPYSVTGTGLWSATFCMVGYVFWRSFSEVSKIAGRASLILGILAALGAASFYAYHRLRNPEERRRLATWVERQSERPLLKPLARIVDPLWRWAFKPTGRVLWPQIRFLFRRFLPGSLGLEFTSAMAVAAAGWYGFIFYADRFETGFRFGPGDRRLLSLAEDLRTDQLVVVAKVVTDLGSLPFVGALVVIGSLILIVKRRPLELFALAGGFALTVFAVDLAKAEIDRPRMQGGLADVTGSSFPSGHAAYSAAYVSMAVIASRVLPGVVSRAALVLVGLAIAAAVGVTRVYLFVHYPSDVIGGWALGLAVLASCAGVALVVGFIRNNGPGEAEAHPPEQS